MKVNCPECKKEAKTPDKIWKYALYSVQLYTCDNCKTSFREYIRDGKHAYTLKKQKGKKGGYAKA